jgi:hypothetical protein
MDEKIDVKRMHGLGQGRDGSLKGGGHLLDHVRRKSRISEVLHKKLLCCAPAGFQLTPGKRGSS